MNYQQWQPLTTAPIGRRVAVNTGGYIFPGTFYHRPNDDLYVVGSYGKIYEWGSIQTWSWSDTEPAAEMLMVKPHGIFCAHWWNEVGHLLNIIRTFGVKTFVELGVQDGGLSALMIDEMSFNAEFRYLGINRGLGTVDPRIRGKLRYSESALADLDLWESATVGTVRAWVTVAGRAFVYCDGGDKAREAHLYWSVLRPGDLLGVHDYSDDPESRGPEVYFSDVSDIIAAGKRLGQDDLKDTRILLVEKI